MKQLAPQFTHRRAVESHREQRGIALLADEVNAAALLPIASLPRDHPAWHYDLLKLSERADAVCRQLAPVMVAVLGFWDHVTRMIRFGEQRLMIDASGSYRLE